MSFPGLSGGKGMLNLPMNSWVPPLTPRLSSTVWTTFSYRSLHLLSLGWVKSLIYYWLFRYHLSLTAVYLAAQAAVLERSSISYDLLLYIKPGIDSFDDNPMCKSHLWSRISFLACNPYGTQTAFATNHGRSQPIRPIALKTLKWMIHLVNNSSEFEIFF